MDQAFLFLPRRTASIVLLSALFFIFTMLNLFNLVLLASLPFNWLTLVNIAAALLLPIPLPWLFYHLWAMRGAAYSLERNGIRLRWGARAVDIPMNRVLWARMDGEDNARLVFPRFYLPGVVLGMGGRRLQDGSLAEVPVEFLASGIHHLVLIATPERVFAISPEDPHALLGTFDELIQYGSLDPIPPLSVFPAFLPRAVLGAPAPRILMFAGLAVNGLLFVIAAMIDPAALSHLAEANPSLPIPTGGMWVLPVINLIICLIEWVGGVVLYRIQNNRLLAYLLWGGGLCASLLFAVAMVRFARMIP